MITHLPPSVATQYTELLRHSVGPLPDGANLSFKKKKIRNRTIWYLYISLGSRRTEHYLGEETGELLETIQRQKALWQSNQEDRDLRARLVSMLISGGAYGLSPAEGRVLGLLEKTGVFLAGGVLIDTFAFQAYANMLGVVWKSGIGTKDIDLAREIQLPVVIDATKSVNLAQSLLESGMGFVEVPTLNRKSPTTKFRILGKELSVELLTPMIGKESSTPILVPALGAYAEPVRFVDFLLENTQIALLLYRHGLLVNVPSPARFALHKLVVSQRRLAAFAEQSKKDIEQASQLLEVLLEQRPGDLMLAYDAAGKMGEKFNMQLQAGLQRLNSGLRSSLQDIF